MPEPSESFPKPSFASEPSFNRQPISFQNQESKSTFGKPTFYNGQRYSDMISSRVSNDPEPIFVDPVKPSNERYDSYDDDDELEATYQVPYQEQSIRRLDGPFEPYVPPKPKEEKKPKRTLLKLKIKKPVDKLEERRDSIQYPNWRQPIQPLNTITEDPIKYQKYQEDPKYEYNDDEYYYDQEDEPYYREYEEYKPASYSKYEIYSTTPKPYEPKEPSYQPPQEPQPYKRDSYYDSPSVRYPSYQAPTTRYPTYNTPVTRSYPTFNTPEPVPIPEQGPSYEGPRFTVIKDAQDRQSAPDFGSGFEIPTFFKSSFEAPAFAEFNPPFGNSGIFIDFLKTAAKDDPFESTPFSARVESKTINTESSVPEIHRYGAFDTTANTIPFGYAKTEAAPGFYSTLLYTTPTTLAPSTTTVPSGYQAPELPKYKPEEPKYKPKEPSYQQPQEPSYQAPKQPEQPKYQPKEPEPSYQPPFQPYEPKEPSYQPPSEPELPKYNKPTYRPPIKAMKDTTEQPPETTTELEKPTESSVYYKPPEGGENQELTPGPVYYKPLDDSTTTTSTTTIKTSTVDNDSFSAPKAPSKKAKRPPPKKKPSRPSRPRKVKKPFLKMPSLKFPKLPKPSALIRRPSKKSDHRPPRPKSVQNRPKPRPKSDLAPPKKEYQKKPKNSAKTPKKQPKSHSKLLGSISDMMKKPIHRKGPSVAQSTGVLLPYVLSFLH